jgi:RNase H-fold protein (predicted Holliday junction resolvase)
MIAFPHSGFRRSSLAEDRAVISKIVAERGVTCAVVGMPVAPSGLECNALREFVRAYTGALTSGCGIRAVAFADETFSTLEAANNVADSAKRSVRRDPSRMKRAIDSVRRHRARVEPFGRPSVPAAVAQTDFQCPRRRAQNAATVILQDAVDLLKERERQAAGPPSSATRHGTRKS